MNAISLYITTSRLVLENDSSDNNLTDLYRLLPYLRQSLSCKSCGNLLLVPYSSNTAKCQHYACKVCIDERRTMKSQCAWCYDKQNFVENRQMRILLQCYKSLCEHIIMTPLYQQIRNAYGNEKIAPVTIASIADLIEEGAKFEDDFSSTSGLSKSAYSILPFVCNTSNVSATQNNSTPKHIPIPPLQTTHQNIITAPSLYPSSKSNDSDTGPTNHVSQKQSPQSNQITSCSPSVYSVLYAGTGNKITIKRKLDGNSIIPTSLVAAPTAIPATNNLINTSPVNFKMPMHTTAMQTTPIQIHQQNIIKTKPIGIQMQSANKRKGCRCGNATLTPGKLTCCGQRCPCYVESKSCIDCKCRGCRNPHHPNGFKVRPLLVQQTQHQQHHNLHNQQTPTTLHIQQHHQLHPTSTNMIKPVQIQTPVQISHSQLSHAVTVVSQPSLTTLATSSMGPPQLYTISDQIIKPIQITNSDNTRQCLQFAQFINGTSTGHQFTTPAVTSTTNFSQLLNNTIIFNPADIPTIIDGGSIQTAEISIDL